MVSNIYKLSTSDQEGIYFQCNHIFQDFDKEILSCFFIPLIHEKQEGLSFQDEELILTHNEEHTSLQFIYREAYIDNLNKRYKNWTFDKNLKLILNI